MPLCRDMFCFGLSGQPISQGVVAIPAFSHILCRRNGFGSYFVVQGLFFFQSQLTQVQLAIGRCPGNRTPLLRIWTKRHRYWPELWSGGHLGAACSSRSPSTGKWSKLKRAGMWHLSPKGWSWRAAASLLKAYPCPSSFCMMLACVLFLKIPWVF